MNKAKTLVFLCGTSGVGKTEFLDIVEDHFPIGKTYLFRKCYISARDSRSKLGNPSWEEIILNTDLATKMQNLVMDDFSNKIEEQIKEFEKSDEILCMFERSLLDISGYSHAYGLDPLMIRDHVQKHWDLIASLREKGFNVKLIKGVIDHTLGYDRDGDARPPIEVRLLCDDFIRKQLEKILHKELHYGSRKSTAKQLVELTFQN